MDKYDFTEFCKLGGSLVDGYVAKLIQLDRKKFKEWHDAKEFEVKIQDGQAKWMLNQTDVEFEQMYYTVPKDTDAFIAMISQRNGIMYRYIYSAYLTNVDLLRRCLALSDIPINNVLRVLSNRDALGHVNVNIECYKLLNTANKSDMLLTAYYADNYECMQYVVNNMTGADVFYFLANAPSKLTVLNILILDRIIILNDKYLMTSYVEIHRSIQTQDDILINCYYIIKCLSRLDGVKYMLKQDEILQVEINNLANSELVIELNTKLSCVYNQLLEYHFNPK
jgi:hypothetical protein